MQNSFPDERYSVADEAILGAFFKLLKKKTPDQITVSDITKTAGIARSTFYNLITVQENYDNYLLSLYLCNCDVTNYKIKWLKESF